MAAQRAALAGSEALRDAHPGAAIQQQLGGGSFRSQMKKADRSGARIALLWGEDEVARGRGHREDAAGDGEQQRMPMDELRVPAQLLGRGCPTLDESAGIRESGKLSYGRRTGRRPQALVEGERPQHGAGRGAGARRSALAGRPGRQSVSSRGPERLPAFSRCWQALAAEDRWGAGPARGAGPRIKDEHRGSTYAQFAALHLARLAVKRATSPRPRRSCAGCWRWRSRR
jgi:hypothetical protein